MKTSKLYLGYVNSRWFTAGTAISPQISAISPQIQAIYPKIQAIYPQIQAIIYKYRRFLNRYSRFLHKYRRSTYTGYFFNNGAFFDIVISVHKNIRKSTDRYYVFIII